MSPELYQKENNLFQSLNWIAFQENFGRKAVRAVDNTGIVLGLPFGQKFAWFQKAPVKFTAGFVKEARKIPAAFVRIEPGKLSEAEVSKYGLRVVTKKSLLSGQASPKATQVLDLRLTEQELLTQMKPKTRYNIRLAEKRGVTVKRLDDDDILFEMLTSTAQKATGYAPHEKSYYTKMIKDLAKNEVAHIYVAEHEGDFLAAIMVGFFGNTAIYLHGGQNDLKKNIMAPYLCQWAAIKEAKARGCEHYDFWGVAETDDQNDPWAGITRFKEGFGGEKIIFPGSYDLVLRPFWYNILTLGAKIKHLGRK